jgi:hypothetical protein
MSKAEGRVNAHGDGERNRKLHEGRDCNSRHRNAKLHHLIDRAGIVPQLSPAEKKQSREQ